MMNTKKTAFGIAGVAAASLLTLGLTTPAFASSPDSHSSSSSYTSSSNSQLSKNYEQMIERVTQILDGNTNYAPVVVSPQVGIGSVASGNNVGSGNTTSVPVLSGNETALGSGNTTNTGNGTSVLNGSGNGDGNGNSASNSQGNQNSASASNTTGQIGDNVNQTVTGILGGLGLSSSSDGGQW
jgi:hypothetical protein